MPTPSIRFGLGLAITLPALAVSWGFTNGQVVFVLYREPKLALAMITAWCSIAAVAWLRPRAVFPRELLATLTKPSPSRPSLMLAALFLGWLTVTGLWSPVRQLYLYEILQYLTFGALVWVLLTWSRLEVGIADAVRAGIVASLGLVTIIGLAQLSGFFPALESWLRPINPQFGADHPSLMGYKNPAALAVLGQIFLLAGWVWTSRSRKLRLLLIGLLAAELFYLATLHSRTSYLALAVGATFLVTVFLVKWRHGGLRPDPSKAIPIQRLGLVAAVLLSIFAIALIADPATRQRAASMGQFLSVEGYLQSDRGTYFRNTLEMVKQHPSGVGLGHWQTFYPVFRKYDRSRSFDESFQVRRAHSDHVQLLGETGWVGAGLWLALLGSVLYACLRHGGREGSWTGAQWTALIVAMATDYVQEMPYHKLLLFLVAFLALSRLTDRGDEDPMSSAPPAFPSGAFLRAATLTWVALGISLVAAEHLRKQQLSAELLRRYSGAMDDLRRDGRVERTSLQALLQLGEQTASLRGFTKVDHRRHLALAHTASLLGDRGSAFKHAACALEIHPYSPKAMAMMSSLTEAPESQKWSRAYRHVMHEATSGFELDLPKIPTNCPD